MSVSASATCFASGDHSNSTGPDFPPALQSYDDAELPVLRRLANRARNEPFNVVATIIFALANPDPEVTPEEVKEIRDDAIMATGRSDYPNQVNNVLGFPFLFRGALDVRARQINEAMMLAATKA